VICAVTGTGLGFALVLFCLDESVISELATETEEEKSKKD
jgi:hypothetical protein